MGLEGFLDLATSFWLQFSLESIYLALSKCPESSTECVWFITDISNKPSSRQEHPGISDGPDSSGGTSHPLTENQIRWVALPKSLAAAILPSLAFLRCVALYITLEAPASGFFYFASGMWRHIHTIRTSRV
jgi:hypothetical protein